MPEREMRFLFKDEHRSDFYTPTELGKKFSPQLSAKKLNSLLKDHGYQERVQYMPNKFTYRIKPLGESMGALYGPKNPAKPDECEWRTIWPISILNELQLQIAR